MRLAALAVLLVSLSSRAAEPWDAPPFSADPAALAGAAAALPTPRDADAEVLLEEGTYRYDAQGRETYTYRLVYRVLTPAGAKDWDTIAAGYAPWHEERPVLRARVITPEGRSHELDAATLVESTPESPEPETFTDHRLLQGPLPAITVGALVEELIVTRETAPLFASGTARRFFLGKNVPVRKVRLLLEAPRDTRLAAFSRGLAVRPRRSVENGNTRLLFEFGPLPAYDGSETYPDGVSWPHVAFSTGRAWKDLAQRYHETVEAQLAGSNLEKTAREVVGTEKRREVVVSKLVAWVHSQVRYTGLQFGEAAFVPRSPEETLVRRYGDCKDLSTLLVGLLRASGIPASLALLRTQTDDVVETLPGFGLFDHAIVYVPGKTPLWIDATDDFALPGQLPPPAQGRLALVAAPTTEGLLRTPESTSADNTFTTSRDVFLAESGASRISEVKEMTGALAAMYREHFTRTEGAHVREGYVEFAKKVFLAQDVARLEPKALTELDKPFRVELEVKGASRGFTDEKEAAVGLSPFSLLSSLPGALFPDEKEEKDAQEPGPDTLVPPYQGTLRYRVVAPPGYTPRSPPPSFHLQLGPARYSGEYSVKGGEVLATFRFDSGPRHWKADDVRAFRDALRPLRDEDEPLLFFDSEGATLKAAGRIAESLAAYRQLVALHPHEALHHAQLALALLEAGAGDEARAEARTATVVEPNSVLGWRAQGWVLQHDALGRRFKPGFDLGGALSAYRAARATAPKDFETRGDFAILLEHDAHGERYTPGARLDEAITEYKVLRDELEHKELDDNLLLDVFLAGRYEEVLKLAPTMAQSPLHDSLRVAASALVDGVPAAARNAARWVTAPEARRTAMDAAVTRLMGLRRYPEAHALLTEAVRGAPNAGEQQGRLATLAKVTRFDEKTLKEDDPRTAVRRLLVAVLSPEESEEAKVKGLFSQAVLADEPDAARVALSVARSILRRAGSDSVLPPLTTLDVTLATQELRVDGDARVGFRVQSQPASGASGNGHAWFVVREGGRYRLLAFGTDSAALGLEALRRAEAGDVAGARRWLDWARDTLPGTLAEHQRGAGFLRLWTAQGPSADKDTVRLAAASLVAHGPRAVRAIPLLAAAREKAETDEARRALDRDLAAAYVNAKRFPQLLEVARRTLETSPSDVLAFLQTYQALTQLERREEAARLAEARLKRQPEDSVALELLASAAAARGDLAAAQGFRRRVVEAGKADAATYNNLAWTALLLGQVNDSVVEDAQRAASLSGYKQASILHTLATLYAETGKGPEARQLLLKSLELRGTDTLEAHDWYVVGRIAEGYGLTDTARAAYAKAKSAKPGPDTLDGLAQARLKALGPTRTATPTP